MVVERKQGIESKIQGEVDLEYYSLLTLITLRHSLQVLLTPHKHLISSLTLYLLRKLLVTPRILHHTTSNSSIHPIPNSSSQHLMVPNQDLIPPMQVLDRRVLHLTTTLKVHHHSPNFQLHLIRL